MFVFNICINVNGAAAGSEAWIRTVFFNYCSIVLSEGVQYLQSNGCYIAGNILRAVLVILVCFLKKIVN